MDKLKEQKANLGKGTSDSKRRRPSTIAEQPGKALSGVEDFQSLRLRTTSENDREADNRRTPERISFSPGRDKTEMSATDNKCLTCHSPIFDNTTSTTSCVKCARLRIRRMNFAHPPPNTLGVSSGVGRESSDSGVSSGSQDCGETTPTLSHPPVCGPTQSSTLSQSRVVKRDGANVNTNHSQFSTLVRKLSEVEGINPSHILRSMKTSIDEGVELDYPDSCSNSSSSHTPGSSSMWTCDSQRSSIGRLSSSGSGGGQESDHSTNRDYNSFENFSFDPGWSQSLPSCKDDGKIEQTTETEVNNGALQTNRGLGVR